MRWFDQSSQLLVGLDLSQTKFLKHMVLVEQNELVASICIFELQSLGHCLNLTFVEQALDNNSLPVLRHQDLEEWLILILLLLIFLFSIWILLCVWGFWTTIFPEVS